MNIRKTTIWTGAAVLAAAAVAVFAAQGTPMLNSFGDVSAAIKSLGDRVTVLEARLALLERPGAETGGGSGGGGGISGGGLEVPAGMHVMKIISMSTVPPDPAVAKQVATLNQEADDLEQKADTLTSSASSVQDDDDGAGQFGERREGNSALSQRAMYHRQASEARIQAIRKRDQATALAGPRQTIRGWNGEQMVTLQSDRDLSALLSDLDVGSFITWRGRMMEAAPGTAGYLVSSVQPANAPAGFKDSPGKQ